jgi:predicted phage tail protein
MNLVGKIFVVLILVFSLFFMGLAVTIYAMHKNWKDEIERPQTAVKPGEPLGLKPQLAQAQAQVTDLQRQVDNLRNALSREEASKRQQLAKLEAEKTQLRSEHTQLVNEQALLTQGERQAVEAAKANQAMLDAKLSEIDTLRAEIKQAYADRDAHFKEVVAKTDELNKLLGEKERLAASHSVLAEQVAKAKLVLDSRGLDINEPVNGPPKVDGIVLKSSRSGLVEISLGSDEGLRKGHQLVVYRNGGKYVGKIEVIETRADRSVAKVMPDPEFRQSPILKEDRVATRIN